MNLYSPPIKWIVFGRRYVRLNTSFRTILKCYEIFADDLLNDYEKIDLCLRFLVWPFFLWFLPPKKKVELFGQIYEKFIDIQGKKKQSNEKQFDFNQDADSIYSSFWQCYHIDLIGKHKNLHWWSFVALFNGLSDDTKMMQIISVRSRPLPKPTKYNAEERQQLIKLKQLYRLEISEEERKNQYQQGLAKIAATLQNLAQRS